MRRLVEPPSSLHMVCVLADRMWSCMHMLAMQGRAAGLHLIVGVCYPNIAPWL